MDEHTQAPWRWELNPKAHSIRLQGRGQMVMDFVRWGMDRATPRFIRDGLMFRADEFGAPIPGQEHHAAWDQIINHADARLIAAAPRLLEACGSVLIGLQNGQGSVPFMITMLRGALLEAGAPAPTEASHGEP